MKLIEINNICDECSWDSCDEKFDAIVHLELDKIMLSNELKWIKRFTKALYQKVDVVKIFDGAYAKICCNYSKLFEDNLDLWKAYTSNNWKEQFHNLCEEDIDEYIYQLIESLNDWLSGSENDEGYKELYEVLIRCKD